MPHLVEFLIALGILVLLIFLDDKATRFFGRRNRIKSRY